jgi:hypothetical protein
VIETAAVVPQPPLLVPELAGRAVGETPELRAACLDAARRLAAVARRWLVVGVAPTSSRHAAPTCGTFAGFGADVRISLAGPDAPGADPAGEPDRDLPLPVLVAGWLRGQAGAAAEGVTIDAHVVAAGASPQDCRRAGAELAAGLGDEPTALLVVGDGAATHTPRAPGALDERAGPYDRTVADALQRGDADALLALDPELSDALLVAGRVPWQVLAGALPAPSTARLLHSSAPYGVAYHVAVWER